MKRLLAALAMTLSAAAVAQDEDPYLWLEEVSGERAMKWVTDQNARSRPEIEKDRGFHPLLNRFTEIATSRERIPTVAKLGPHLYNYWQDAANPRGLWRRTTLEEYRKAEPRWETVLDLDRLSADEKEQWAWKGATCLFPKYERCLVSISRGGSDAVEIREFDLVKKAFVAGGFRLPQSKGGVAWIDEDAIYVSRDFGPGTVTKSGYPRQVKRLARGQALADAAPVFEVSEDDIGAWPSVTHEKDGRVEMVTRVISTRRNEAFVVRDGKLVKLELPDTVDASVTAGWLYVRLREDWKPAATAYAAGSLLALPLEKFLGGDRGFDVLFAPGPRVSLDAFVPLKSMVLLDLLDNVSSRLVEARRGEDGKWTKRDVDAPKLSNLGAAAFDRRESDDYFLFVTGFTTPTTLHLAKGGTDAREKLKSLPDFFDASNLAVTQHEATSKDGTKIPYFQVMRKDAKADGKNPTILYGYGGFEVSQVPTYSGFVGNGWLAKGGVWVLSNLRGGGEFGPQWNRVARREGRQKTHDDYAAVAEDLIRRKVTSPAKLGILGGSQGGLLVSATMLQRPELFGAVVATVPLMDMKRYHKLLAGHSWMGEYGDPDKPEDWAFISKYSPYQNVLRGRAYPKMLITTSTRDDRVHPGHARKMAARMQQFGYDTTYFEYTEGGHGSGTTPAQTAYTWAFIYTFFAKSLM
ncbi:MAG: prolyl oligopeptidase family serine peptidase [Burkholderiales bacterium]|nr:prolyl oligopeptidase family serine peptidase [Burkholderiales bacterium]MCL4687690.1 prolyl oligopeptidase family serine peptidase [Burkholderiales bacterium]